MGRVLISYQNLFELLVKKRSVFRFLLTSSFKQFTLSNLMTKLSTYAWISALLGIFLLLLIKDQIQIEPIIGLNESMINQKVKTRLD